MARPPPLSTIDVALARPAQPSQLATVARVQLAQQRRHVCLDGALRHEHPRRDLGVRQVLTEPGQHLSLLAGDPTCNQRIRHPPHDRARGPATGAGRHARATPYQYPCWVRRRDSVGRRTLPPDGSGDGGHTAKRPRRCDAPTTATCRSATARMDRTTASIRHRRVRRRRGHVRPPFLPEPAATSLGQAAARALSRSRDRPRRAVRHRSLLPPRRRGRTPSRRHRPVGQHAHRGATPRRRHRPPTRRSPRAVVR